MSQRKNGIGEAELSDSDTITDDYTKALKNQVANLQKELADSRDTVQDLRWSAIDDYDTIKSLKIAVEELRLQLQTMTEAKHKSDESNTKMMAIVDGHKKYAKDVKDCLVDVIQGHLRGMETLQENMEKFENETFELLIQL